MSIKILKSKQALNKAFLKVKPNRKEIEEFKSNLIKLIDRTNESESEEFHKNLVIDFLNKTYYKLNHYKGKNDLEIHTGDKAKSNEMEINLNCRRDPFYLENQIDQSFYEMYGLSEEEIEIVEGGKDE